MGRQESRGQELTELEPQSIWTNDDPRLHLAAWDADGPPVLLVHGMGANLRWWDDVVPRLIEGGLRPVGLDFSGHGDSGRRERYDLDSWVEDIETARHALGWSRFAIAAHSLGARVSLEYAARHPDRLTKLVAVDFLPEVWDSRASRFAKRRPKETPTYATKAEALERFHLQPEGTRLPDSRVAALGQDCVRPTKDGRWTWKFDWKAFSYEYSPIWPTLPKVSTPTLHVRGEHSTVVNRDQFARIVKETRGSKSVELSDAHHHVPLDVPEALAKEIVSFLDS